MSTLTDLTITQALAGLEKKEFTSVELTQASIDRMEEMRGLNAFVTETPELALAQAKASDEKRAGGNEGMLEGVPIAVKDMFCTKGVRSTASSKMLENFVPDYESTVTQKMFDQGGVMIGKTALDEFAMGASTMTNYFGNVINPWKNKNRPDVDLGPGGSSGGSAAAIAARITPGALGTDTNGSVRQPASFCGITGLKPTYGRCSRWGTIAFASSLDQAGVFTHTVEDSALMLQAISGHDPKDATSAKIDVPNWVGSVKDGVKGLRVGIPKEFTVDGMPEEIQTLWDQGAQWLKDAGAEIVEISLPHAKYAVPAYYIIAPAEASSNLARYDGVRYGHRAADPKDLNDMYSRTRAEGFGDEVKRRIMLGTYALSSGYYDAYYLKAQRVRRKIYDDFTAAYEKCDVILAPTSPGAAFAIGEKMDDPVKMYLEDIFTSPASLAGLPGMSVPAGLNADGLPLGLQVVGRSWDEETVLRAGYVIEQAAGFKGL